MRLFYFVAILFAVALSSLLTGCNWHEYDDARGFSEGYAAVKIDGKWGFIDMKGKIAIPCKYENVGDFNGNSFAMIETDTSSLWGIADKTGVIVVPKYKEIVNLQYGKYLAYINNSGWGIIDKTGKELTPKDFYSYAIIALPENYNGLTLDDLCLDPYFSKRYVLEYRESGIFFSSIAEHHAYYFRYNKTNNKNFKKVVIFNIPFGYGSQGSDYDHELLNDCRFWLIDSNIKEVNRFLEKKVNNEFVEGMKIVEEDGKYGFIDSLGNKVVECKYDKVYNFSEGLARVAKYYCPSYPCIEDDYRYGFIDRTGKEIIPLQYSYCNDFENGKAIAWRGKQCGIIDRNGNTLLPFNYTNISMNAKGAIISSGENYYRYYGIIDSACHITVPVKFKNIQHYSDNLFLLFSDDKILVTDISGKVMITLSLVHYYPVCENGFLYLTLGSYHPQQLLIRQDDKFVFREYDYISIFKFDSVALVERDSKKGLIDRKGNYLVPLIDVDEIEFPKDGIAIIKKNNEFGLADSTGIIVPCGKYQEMNEFCGDMSLVTSQTVLYGYIDRNGTEVIPCIYYKANNFSEGYATVAKEITKSFFIDKNGDKLENRNWFLKIYRSVF